MNLIAYIRVSTREQGVSGLGMEAQQATITKHAEANGITICRWAQDIVSTRKDKRPGLEGALLEAAGPDCDGIIVAKLDRLARSQLETATHIATAMREGWSLVSLSPSIDMTTAYGRAMAGFAGVMAELERDLISERTRDALAAKKARGEHVGRHIEVSEEAQRIVRSMHERGMSQRRIAMRLEREKIPTPRGGAWSRATVQKMVERL